MFFKFNPRKGKKLMTKSEIEILNLLSKGQGILEKLKTELADPACHKRFRQNVHLLLGAHDMTLTTLAKKSGRGVDEMSRLLAGKTKFERTSLESFEKVAKVLGVSTHSLLFIDLQKNFFEMIKLIEKETA